MVPCPWPQQAVPPAGRQAQRRRDCERGEQAMVRPIDLMRQGRKEALWQMCCGFIDLSLDQFMEVQHRLLLEQIELLKRCELCQRVMHRAQPVTVDYFRNQVPFTTYADYCPELHERLEHGLPAKP